MPTWKKIVMSELGTGENETENTPKEEKVKGIGSVHHLFLQSFEFTVQIAQFFFQAVHFGPMT